MLTRNLQFLSHINNTLIHTLTTFLSVNIDFNKEF